MTDQINNKLRLEVDASDPGFTNLITNHSAAGGSLSGWSAFTGTLTASPNNLGASSTAFKMTPAGTDGNKAVQMRSNAFPLASEQWIGVNVSKEFSGTAAGLYSSLTFFFETSTGTVLSTVNSPLSPGGNSQSFKAQAPAGTANARVMATFLDYTTGGGFTFYMNTWKWMVVKGYTEASVTDVPYTPPAQPIWQNMLGNAYSLNFKRGNVIQGVVDSIEIGTLTASLSDPLFDPTKNSRVRPGRSIRVMWEQYSGNWVPLWNGSISSIEVNYKDRKPRVNITGVDTWAKFNSVVVPTAYAGSLKQRAGYAASVLGLGVWGYTGSLDPEIASTPIDSQPNTTALQVVELATVVKNGYAFADTDGFVRTNIYAATSTDTAVTFSDNPSPGGDVYYTDIDTSFGSQALTNQLMITRHNFDETEDGGTKTYGPYTNAASVASWGTKSATVEVNDGVPLSIATNYLKTYANPEIFASQVKFNGRNMPNMVTSAKTAAMSGLYQRAVVKHAQSGLNTTYRIINIEHDVTPDRWEVTVGFKPLEASAAVTVTNPPGGANSGPSDVTPPAPGILGSRYRSANYNMAYATYVTVPLDAADTMDGITWDNSNNRFIIPRTGRYQVNAAFRMAAPGIRACRVDVNGNTKIENVASGGEESAVIAKVLKLNAGDVVSLLGLQYVGNPTAMVYGGAPNRNVYMDIAFLGE